MSRIDHARTNSRDLIRQRGADSIDGGLPDEFRAAPRKGPSKADMRAELAAATAAITRTVRCRCGHSATVALPPARLGAKLRCSRCGKIANGPGNEKGRHHKGVGPKS